MKRDITKTCADFLRSYLNDKHSIKLKSGHAHEIVAAFFGYKSKIALLADTQHPLSEPPPINESISGVNPDKLWATLRRHINGTEAIHGGADYRAFAAG